MLEPDLEFYQDGVTDDGVAARIYITVQREVYGESLVVSLVRHGDDEPRYPVVVDRDNGKWLITETLPELIEARRRPPRIQGGGDFDVVWTDPELSGMTYPPQMFPDDPGMGVVTLRVSSGWSPEPDMVTWELPTASDEEPNPIIAVRLTLDAADEFLGELNQCAAYLGWKQGDDR